jgi:NAD(P)-dependent dehydrogenase (short-subunit alcohol dehydrogenase family)
MKPTTLITGSGRRIGAAIARHLAAQGHDLVLHYHRSKDEVALLKEEIVARRPSPVASKDGGVSVTLVQADLEDALAVQEFWDGLPPVTNIIHNASRYTRDKLADFTVADVRAHMAVNLEAPLVLTQGFMAQLPVGVVGNVMVLGDDALGWSVSPEFFSYAVSKHAWVSTIALLAAAVAPRARANLIALAPTLPNTNDPEGMFARLATRAPLQRTGEVAEVLAAVDYLLGAVGTTGQVLHLGNGMASAVKRS